MQSLLDDNANDAKPIADCAEIALPVDSFCFEARHLSGAKTCPMGSYPYEGLHAEAVGIDADRVQLIGPEPDISIRRIVVFRAKEHTDQPTDPSVSHSSESGDVTGPTAWTEPTTFHVVCAIHERVSKRTYRATVH
jgi:hypothetical protein